MFSFLTEIFRNFYEKTLVKRKSFTKIVLTNNKNPEHIQKCFGKKTKIDMPFVIQNVTFSLSVNHGGRHFFETLPRPPPPPPELF